MKILGIDIGRVIIGGDGKEDTSFFTNGFLYAVLKRFKLTRWS